MSLSWSKNTSLYLDAEQDRAGIRSTYIPKPVAKLFFSHFLADMENKIHFECLLAHH